MGIKQNEMVLGQVNILKPAGSRGKAAKTIILSFFCLEILWHSTKNSGEKYFFKLASFIF